MEVVFVKIGGTTFRALTEPELARKLVVLAGVPDQRWQTIAPEGAPGMQGSSLHALARSAPKPVSNIRIEALAKEKTELQLRLLELNEPSEIAKTRGRLQEIEWLIEEWTQQP
jgi:hypothetical protein